MGRFIAIPPLGAPRHTVYLDTSAFSRLWRGSPLTDDESTELRARFLSPDFASRPNIVLSQWLLTEMSARLDHVKVASLIETKLSFIARLPSFLLLHEPMTAMRAEVAAALRGEPLNVFFSEGTRIPIDCEDTWRLEHQRRDEDRAAFAASHERARAGLKAGCPDRSKLASKLKSEVLPDLKHVATEWALRAMEADRDKLGLPADSAAWPSPEALPSIWSCAAFQTAYFYVINHDGRAIDPNDFHDWCHYVAAAHADEFVSSDRKLLDIGAACPAPKPVVSTFEEWARRLLAAPR